MSSRVAKNITSSRYASCTRMSSLSASANIFGKQAVLSIKANQGRVFPGLGKPFGYDKLLSGA